MSDNPFPPAFIWTKMQAEAGQSLDDIIRRKEMERAAGGGLFFWGIGNALGDNLRKLVAREETPSVLFSIMRSRPKRQDIAPDALLLWTAFVDWGGRVHAIPPHALVLSRSKTATGEKRRHFALVCRSTQPLRLQQHGTLKASHFRNLGSNSPRIGASQVTAVIEHDTPLLPHHIPASKTRGSLVPTEGAAYDVNMRAELVAPYFIRLARPVLVPVDARKTLETLSVAHLTVSDWVAFANTVRNHCEAAASTQAAMMEADLFGPVE